VVVVEPVTPGVDSQGLNGAQFFPADRFQTVALLAHAVFPIFGGVPEQNHGGRNPPCKKAPGRQRLRPPQEGCQRQGEGLLEKQKARARPAIQKNRAILCFRQVNRKTEAGEALAWAHALL